MAPPPTPLDWLDPKGVAPATQKSMLYALDDESCKGYIEAIP